MLSRLCVTLEHLDWLEFLFSFSESQGLGSLLSFPNMLYCLESSDINLFTSIFILNLFNLSVDIFKSFSHIFYYSLGVFLFCPILNLKLDCECLKMMVNLLVQFFSLSLLLLEFLNHLTLHLLVRFVHFLFAQSHFFELLLFEL